MRLSARSSLFTVIGSLLLMLTATADARHPFLQPLFPSDAAQRGFGYAVDISGRWAMVVSPGTSIVESPYQRGSVFVFAQGPRQEWVQRQRLRPPLGPSGTFWAGAVAMERRTAVIGGEEAGHLHGEGQHGLLGVVHVYQLGPGQRWAHSARIPSPASAIGGRFGESVALSGDRLLVAANEEDEGAGAVYVFERRGGEWLLDARLEAPVRAVREYFGTGMALIDDMAIIGTRDAAYVFVRVGRGHWELRQQLASDPAQSRSGFGQAVDVSSRGDRLVVGAAG
jgi:hypothetical protein